MKKIPLYIQIIIGMAIGVLWGLLAVNIGAEKFYYKLDQTLGHNFP